MKRGLVMMIVVFLATLLGAEVRTWSDASGKYAIEAEFVRVASGKVVLKKSADGKTVSVPIAKLSKKDRDWLRERAGAGPTANLANSWPQWLGPNRNGHTTASSGKWPPKKLWEKSFGQSDSSPIIVGGRIYLSTLDGNETSVKCVEAKTGTVVWEGKTPGGRYGRHSNGDKQSYMGPLATAACDGKLLFTVSVDGDLQCWDAASGDKRWGFNLYAKYRMGKRKHIRDYGYTTSPMLLDSDILVEVGGSKGAVMAFNRVSGSEKSSWGKGQLGHSGGPAGPDGKVFFGLDYLSIKGVQIPWRTDYACNIATPAVSGDYVVCTSAYNMRKTVCYKNAKELWKSKYHCKTASPVINEKAGHVYLTETGRCLDLKTGKPLWNFPRAVNVIVTGDDKLIMFDREIRLFDLQGKLLNRVPAIDRGWPSGALGDGFLVFKNRSQVVCYSVE